MPTDSKNVCQTALSGTFNGEPFTNVLHFWKRDNTDMTIADLTAIHGILDDAATDSDAWKHLFQTMDSGAVVDTIHSRTMSTTAAIELVSTVSLGGSSAGSDAQPLLAIMVKWTGPYANRRNRGRTFLCGFNTGLWDTSDTDRVDSGILASMTTRIADWIAAWGANATYGFVVYSRKAQSENDPAPYSEVVGGSVATRVALQTRRSPGR